MPRNRAFNMKCEGEPNINKIDNLTITGGPGGLGGGDGMNIVWGLKQSMRNINYVLSHR